MASKSAQQEPEKAEVIEEALELIENTLDRVKVLYEQYFLGIQKQPPTHIHSDVERKLRDLAQLQIRNTALRYRFATVQQKYGSYNSYWRRTLRQIEAGTYHRNLSKIGRQSVQTGEVIPEEILAAMPKRMREQVRRDRENALAQQRRRKVEATVGDDELLTLEPLPQAVEEAEELDDGEDFGFVKESTELRKNALQSSQSGGMHVIEDSDADMDFEAFFAGVEQVDDPPPAPPPPAAKAPPVRDPRGAPATRTSEPSSPTVTSAIRSILDVPVKPSPVPTDPAGAPPFGLRPGQPTPVVGSRSVAGARAGQAPVTPPARPPTKQPPDASESGRPVAGQPSVTSPTKRPVAGQVPAQGRSAVSPPNPASVRRAIPIESDVRQQTAQGLPTVRPPGTVPVPIESDVRQRTAQGLPTVRPPGPSRPPGFAGQAGQAGAKQPVPVESGRRTQPLPKPPLTQPLPKPPPVDSGQLTQPVKPPIFTRPLPKVPPIAPSQITRPNPIAAGGSVGRPNVPVQSMSGPFPREAPKPQPPPETRQAPPPGMSDADVNALYAKYVKAKEAVGEAPGPGAYGKLLKTINAQAPKIMEQYKSKGVDFSVVVKDNQVIIRAKPKP